MPFFNNKIRNSTNIISNYNDNSDNSDNATDNDSNNKYIYNDDNDDNDNDDNNDNNKNKLHKIKNTKQSKKTITIYEYNPDRQYEISINKFLEILNNIPTSSNAVDICKYINHNLYDTDIPKFETISTRYSETYKNIFNGNKNSESEQRILHIINCDVKPKINKKTFDSVKYIKMKIHEFMNKKQFDNLTAEWIGVLAGLVMYFKNIDEFNFNKTNFANEINKTFTIKDL